MLLLYSLFLLLMSCSENYVLTSNDEYQNIDLYLWCINILEQHRIVKTLEVGRSEISEPERKKPTTKNYFDVERKQPYTLPPYKNNICGEDLFKTFDDFRTKSNSCHNKIVFVQLTTFWVKMGSDKELVEIIRDNNTKIVSHKQTQFKSKEHFKDLKLGTQKYIDSRSPMFVII